MHLVLGEQVPRLNHVVIGFPVKTLRGGCYGPLKVEYHFFDTFMKG